MRPSPPDSQISQPSLPSAAHEEPATVPVTPPAAAVAVAPAEEVVEYLSRIQQLEADLQQRDARIAELEALNTSTASGADAVVVPVAAPQPEMEALQASLQELRERTSAQEMQINELLCRIEEQRTAVVETLQQPTDSDSTAAASSEATGEATSLPGSSSVSDFRTQQIQRLQTKLSSRKLFEPLSFPSYDSADEDPPIPQTIEVPTQLYQREAGAGVDETGAGETGAAPVTFDEVFDLIQDFRKDVILKYREMAGTQDRAIHGISSFQLETLRTLTENENLLPAPWDGSHTAFGRFRRRLREMSCRVLRLQTRGE